jgi:predicted nucleotidyltransferase
VLESIIILRAAILILSLLIKGLTVSDKTLDISPTEMEIYRRTARNRAQIKRARLEDRYTRAWEVARRAAALLKGEHGAEKVMVFGSLIHTRLFHPRSDVDLAVWGLPEKDYYRVVAQLLDLDPEIKVDLVEFEHARSGFQDVILREGEEL